MQDVKTQILNIVQEYNSGRPVGYPVLDRKIMQLHPELVKQGLLPALLDELVRDRLLTQVTPSTYTVQSPTS